VSLSVFIMDMAEAHIAGDMHVPPAGDISLLAIRMENLRGCGRESVGKRNPGCAGCR